MIRRVAAVVESDKDIADIARKLLRAADITEIPTPVDRIVEVAQLVKNGSLQLDDYRDTFLNKLTESARDMFLRMGKLLGIADIKERIVYVSADAHPKRVPWITLHEVGHVILPWHHDIALYADDRYTLERRLERKLEAEANAFASHLIFQVNKFDKIAQDYELSAGSVRMLSDQWGAYHSTARRFVERNHRPIALAIYQVSYAEGEAVGQVQLDSEEGWVLIFREPQFVFRYAVQSPTFTERYGVPDWAQGLASTIGDEQFGQTMSAGIASVGEVQIPVPVGGAETFRYEASCNQYDLFVFAIPAKRPKGGDIIIGA